MSADIILAVVAVYYKLRVHLSMNILVTGCNGFVGSALIDYLVSISDVVVTGVCWNKQYSANSDKKVFYISDLALLDEQHTILQSTEVLIHTAGKAHVMEKNDSDDEQVYFHVNTHLTVELAKMVAGCTVKRFIYLSSTKVFGDPVPPVVCFNSGSPTNRTDVYGESKLQAELELTSIAKETGLAVVTIRPPLLYGQGVKGNMVMLSKLARSNLPLPFRAISANRRSMVSLENLIDLVRHRLSNPDAIG